MTNTRSVQRGLLVLMGVVAAIGLRLAPTPPAAAQGPCSGETCVWLPLVRSQAPVSFVREPSVRMEGQTLFADGEIVAAGPEPLYHVILEARVFDAAGTLVQTVPITPELAMTPPSSSNPFLVQASLCCNAARAELAVRSWRATSATTYVSLPVTTIRWTLGSGFAVSVRNERPVPVHDVIIIVHHTLSQLYIHRVPMLAPGETAIYDNPAGDDPWGFFFRTWAQGRLDP
jgi:hypothetical protein